MCIYIYEYTCARVTGGFFSYITPRPVWNLTHSTLSRRAKSALLSRSPSPRGHKRTQREYGAEGVGALFFDGPGLWAHDLLIGPVGNLGLTLDYVEVTSTGVDWSFHL